MTTTSGTVVSSGNVQTVTSGDIAISTTVDSGGILEVYSGGIASSVVDSGFLYLSAGGTVIDTTVTGPGGAEVVGSGGVASSTTVNSGGVLVANSGGVTSGATVNSGALLDVNPGGVASGATVNNGGLLEVNNGGVASGTTVNSGGVQYVLSNGVVDSATLSGGTETVYGTASSTTVNYGGVQNVYSSATASGTILSSGGYQNLSAGNAAGTVVDSGGYEFVYSGGTASSTTVNSGGTQAVMSGGLAVSGTVNDFGGQYVSAGGTAIDTFVGNNAGQIVSSGGVASGTTLGSGGLEYIYSGGVSRDAVVNSGAIQYVSSGGTASGTVNNGGDQRVFSGGTAIGATLNNNGIQSVSSGGTASSATVNSGGTQHVVGGTASNTTISSAGSQTVGSGTAIGTTVSNGGQQFVYSAGRADGTTVTGVGHQYVSSGGVASGTTVSGGGSQDVLASGTASATTLGTNGYQNVSSGGTAYATTVGSGAEQNVLGGGSAISAVVDSVAGQQVFSGGTAIGTALGSGGVENVHSGGVASGATVSSGGELVVSSGGTVSGLVLENGGMLGLASVVYSSGATATFNSATNILTVSDGGHTYTEQLSGSYTGSYFAVTSDTANGSVLVTEQGTPCYCRGTLIMTERGEVAVEDLRIGDRLVTHGGAKRKLRWIGRRAYSGRFAAGNKEVLPVLIHEGALGDGLPRRDLFVSPLHAMYLDGMLIPAAALVNGRSIVQVETMERIEYFHLELKTHDVILAEGAPSESFVDDGSRGMFHNAAEYRTIYPDAPRVPAQYCAPRIEDGEEVETVRRRLARLAGMDEDGVPMALEGFLDTVEDGRITGWAYAPGSLSPVSLRILDNGAVIGRTMADIHRPDLEQAGIGTGCHGFVFDVPGGFSPFVRHVVEVVRESDGQPLGYSPRIVEARPLVVAGSGKPAGTCQGHLDLVTRKRIVGWAWDASDADDVVAVQVLDNGVPIARVMANIERPDLRDAGIGTGRHGFDLIIPAGLSPLARHVIQVVCEQDGTELVGSPMVVEPADHFDDSMEQAIRQAVASVAVGSGGEHVLSFMLGQVDRLRQQQADDMAHRHERSETRRQNRRQGRWLGNSSPRALVLDTRLPRPGHDAGSAAILSHIEALQHLGHEVSLMTTENLGSADAPAIQALEAQGIIVCRRPQYASVEEVLNRQAGCFDVVYLHRAPVAARYMGLSRHYQPAARILYSVADLHHVRLERQAVVQDRPELLALSHRQRLEEFTAAWQADAVITHSLEEMDLLRSAVPEAEVHLVPWAVPVRESLTPHNGRRGVAFIGHYAHEPNRDGALWLAETIMPKVWNTDPAIECMLVGSDMPEVIRRLARPGITVCGQVPDLGSVFDRVRLTVAPLRFGAGIKGKVLDSLAAGVPCVMSEIAAEGLPLTDDLQMLVGHDADGLAALICHLHADDAAHDRAMQAGLSMVRRQHHPMTVIDALRAAIEGYDAPGISSRRVG